jgi:hypothetical protein
MPASAWSYSDYEVRNGHPNATKCSEAIIRANPTSGGIACFILNGPVAIREIFFLGTGDERPAPHHMCPIFDPANARMEPELGQKKK